MDIEKLEKLNNLKEKGIITQDEFDNQKRKLLENKKSPKSKTAQTSINWNNIGIAFLFALGSFVLALIVSAIIQYINPPISENTKTGLVKLLFVLLSIILALIASKYEVKKYKNTAPVWAVFVGVLLFDALGVWIVSYELLQIKSGFAELKPEKVKQSVSLSSK